LAGGKHRGEQIGLVVLARMRQHDQKCYQMAMIARAGMEMHMTGPKSGAEQYEFINKAFVRHVDLSRVGAPLRRCRGHCKM